MSAEVGNMSTEMIKPPEPFENVQALAEIANGVKELKLDKEAAALKAKEYGFVAPEAYNYTAYNEDKKPANVGADEPLWLSEAVRYEWDDEYGEVGPRHEELEKMLFHDENRMKRGALIQVYDVEVILEGPEKVAPFMKFADAGLHPTMLENVLLCGYDRPTPIQSYTIPSILLGFDVVACAQTGSGKTAAYLIPILSKLMGKAGKLIAPRPNPRNIDPDTIRVRAEPLVLVVCPTRELACQIYDEARRLCYRSKLRPCVVYGGCPPRIQREDLQKGCDVLIATPGRLQDFMGKPNILTLSRVRFTVIDEADELLQEDWTEDLQNIMGGGDSNEDADHLYAMFSATFPKAARTLARQYMADDHIRIRIGRAGSTHSNIKQTVVWVEENAKRQALYDLLFSKPPARTLVFVNSKRQAEHVDDYLFNLGLPSTSIHSDRTQYEREDSIRAFRKGTSPILIATGVSARGLDIKNVLHVINYDLPSVSHGGIEEYVHRIGRTARIGNEGLATSFYNDRNEELADDLAKILLESKQELPDFLQGRVDPDSKLIFDDDSAASDEGAEAGGAGQPEAEPEANDVKWNAGGDNTGGDAENDVQW